MKIINLFNIKVSKNYLLSNVSEEKIEKVKQYISQYNRIDKPILLNDGVLVDNYTRFIAAYLMEMYEIPCIELNDVTYVVGKFDGNNKKYTWKNDKGIDIRLGDMVCVENKDGVDIVEVVGIFKSSDPSLYNKHKSVKSKII